VIFSPRSSVFEAHFQDPLLIIENHDLQWTSLHKILNRKFLIIHIQNWIFDTKTRLQKKLVKNIFTCLEESPNGNKIYP